MLNNDSGVYEGGSPKKTIYIIITRHLSFIACYKAVNIVPQIAVFKGGVKQKGYIFF